MFEAGNRRLQRIVYAAIGLGLAAQGAAAESFCGRSDHTAVLAQLAGAWTGEVSVSVETETLSVTQIATPGHSDISTDGRFQIDFVDQMIGENSALTLMPSDQGYDVDTVDDLLSTTQTEWMADTLSDTLCGPESLPQFTGRIEFAPDLVGDVTLIAYFDDRVLMLSELEARGDHGLAFVTSAALLTPAEDTSE